MKLIPYLAVLSAGVGQAGNVLALQLGVKRTEIPKFAGNGGRRAPNQGGKLLNPGIASLCFPKGDPAI
jgi:hypothetical protein